MCKNLSNNILNQAETIYELSQGKGVKEHIEEIYKELKDNMVQLKCRNDYFSNKAEHKKLYL